MSRRVSSAKAGWLTALPFAHRGLHDGNRSVPENSLAAARAAVAAGYGIECDLQVCTDGVPIVFHDNSLNRITGRKSGSISSRTSAFLTQLDLGSGKRICKLEDALVQLIPRIPVNIEMKFNHLHYRPLVFAVLELLDKHQAQGDVLISSFFHQSLEILNRKNPQVPTAPLFGKMTGAPHDDDLKRISKYRKHWNNNLPFEHPAAVVACDMIDKDMVKRFKKAKLTLLTYTVDEPEEMERLADLGVDGIITNRPDRLDKFLYQRG